MTCQDVPWCGVCVAADVASDVKEKCETLSLKEAGVYSVPAVYFGLPCPTISTVKVSEFDDINVSEFIRAFPFTRQVDEKFKNNERHVCRPFVVMLKLHENCVEVSLGFARFASGLGSTTLRFSTPPGK